MNKHEPQIKHMLKATIPQASPEFIQELEARLVTHLEDRQRTKWGQLNGRRRQRLAAGMVGGLILVIAILASPPLRSVAQEIIEFFRREESDTVSYEYTIPEENEISAPALYSQSIAQVETQAGFYAFQPEALPNGYTFNGALYDPDRKSIMLEYRYNGLALWLSQQRIEDFVNNTFPGIGPSALLEEVSIGNITGQYVEGAWQGGQTDLTDAEPRSTVTIEMVWESTSSIRNLSWQNDGFVFMIMAVGIPDGEIGAALLQEDMIAIAESLVTTSDTQQGDSVP